MRALGRARGVVAVDVERRALVEHERDVRAERGLDLHRGLRAHEALASRRGRSGSARPSSSIARIAPGRSRAVRRAALDLVGDRAVAHREDLEAARVGDDRPVPAHESVQAAEPRDQLVAGRRGTGGTCCRAPCRSRARRPRRTSSVLTDGLRRQRDEGGRADLAVGEPQRARCGRASRGRACWISKRQAASRRASSSDVGGARQDALPRSAASICSSSSSGSKWRRKRSRTPSRCVGRARVEQLARPSSVSTAKQPRPSSVAGVALEQPLALEPVDQPRHAGAAEQHAVGQLGHPQLLAGRGLRG